MIRYLIPCNIWSIIILIVLMLIIAAAIDALDNRSKYIEVTRTLDEIDKDNPL